MINTIGSIQLYFVDGHFFCWCKTIFRNNQIAGKPSALSLPSYIRAGAVSVL